MAFVRERSPALRSPEAENRAVSGRRGARFQSAREPGLLGKLPGLGVPRVHGPGALGGLGMLPELPISDRWVRLGHVWGSGHFPAASLSILPRRGQWVTHTQSLGSPLP